MLTLGLTGSGAGSSHSGINNLGVTQSIALGLTATGTGLGSGAGSVYPSVLVSSDLSRNGEGTNGSGIHGPEVQANGLAGLESQNIVAVLVGIPVKALYRYQTALGLGDDQGDILGCGVIIVHVEGFLTTGGDLISEGERLDHGIAGRLGAGLVGAGLSCFELNVHGVVTGSGDQHSAQLDGISAGGQDRHIVVGHAVCINDLDEEVAAKGVLTLSLSHEGVLNAALSDDIIGDGNGVGTQNQNLVANYGLFGIFGLGGACGGNVVGVAVVEELRRLAVFIQLQAAEVQSHACSDGAIGIGQGHNAVGDGDTVLGSIDRTAAACEGVHQRACCHVDDDGIVTAGGVGAGDIARRLGIGSGIGLVGAGLIAATDLTLNKGVGDGCVALRFG